MSDANKWLIANSHAKWLMHSDANTISSANAGGRAG